MDKRRKELLFLVAGLVVLLAALYFTFKPAHPPAAQARTQGADAATAVGPVSAAAPRPSAVVQAAAPVPMLEGGTNPKRNPFAPAIETTRVAAPRVSPPPLMMASQRPLLPPLQPVPLFPSMTPGAEGASMMPSPGGRTLTVSAPPAEPPLRLTGVVYGDPSIAILRKGDRRYYVRPGDPVGNQYIVQSISHRRVVLASNQGTLSLDLTGRL